MSIFGSIMSAVLGTHPAVAQVETASQVLPSSAGAASAVGDASASQVAPAGVDAAEVLTAKAGQAGQTLDWQHSIVDLMKLLNLDSNLTVRKELTNKLNYKGDINDLKKMNTLLHDKVIYKLL